MPHPVVKPASADGTRGATLRESRSSPVGISLRLHDLALASRRCSYKLARRTCNTCQSWSDHFDLAPNFLYARVFAINAWKNATHVAAKRVSPRHSTKLHVFRRMRPNSSPI